MNREYLPVFFRGCSAYDFRCVPPPTHVSLIMNRQKHTSMYNMSTDAETSTHLHTHLMHAHTHKPLLLPQGSSFLDWLCAPVLTSPPFIKS